MNLPTTFARKGPRNRLSAIDLPYITMPERGVVDSVIDANGNTMPSHWTGLVVSAVSTREFWYVDTKAGKQFASPVGRFNSVDEAIESLNATRVA